MTPEPTPLNLSLTHTSWQLDDAEAAIREILNDTPLPDPRALSKQVRVPLLCLVAS